MSVVPLGNVVCDISQSISSVCLSEKWAQQQQHMKPFSSRR
jgi:hypothetical protein